MTSALPFEADPPGPAVWHDPIDVSVIVPAKDERDSLGTLAQEIADALDGWVPSGGGPCRWELVIVDDGSTDGSWDRIGELAATDPRIRGIRLRRNFGKSSALAAGIEVARGDVLATMDGDLQDDPRELPGMIERLRSGADLVIGNKVDRKDPLGKRLPSRLFNRATSAVTGLRLKDHNCGLKVARREVFEATPLYGDMHRYFAAISHAQGFAVVEQPVNHRPRQHGVSKFGLERYARGGLDLLTVLTLTRYHRRPLHLFGGLGLALGTVGLLILTYLTIVWFVTDRAIGGRPLLLLGALLVVVSVQLASVGLLAELLAHQNATNEDVLRHVVAATAPQHPPAATASTGRATGHEPDTSEHQVRDGVHDPQDDRDGRGADHAEER